MEQNINNNQTEERVLYQWKKINNINIKLAAHNLIIYDDCLYFLFGEKVDALYFEDISNEAIIYSFQEKTKKCIKFPFNRMFASCNQNQEFLYLFGGHNLNVESDNNLYRINLKKLQFELLKVKGDIPTSRRYHSSTILNEKLWLFGGEKFQFNPLSNELYSFDLKKKEWKLIQIINESKQPSKRRYSTLEGKNNKLYMFAGRNELTRMNDIWEFDVLLEIWNLISSTGDIPPPIAACSSCLNGYSIYYFAGNTGNSCNTLYEFDIIFSKWTKIFTTGEIPPTRYWHSAVMNDFNELIIHGGYNEILDNRDDIFKIYLPKRNKNLMFDLFYFFEKNFFQNLNFKFI